MDYSKDLTIFQNSFVSASLFCHLVKKILTVIGWGDVLYNVFCVSRVFFFTLSILIIPGP